MVKLGVGNQESGDAGTETGNTQVGGGSGAESIDTRTEKVDYHIGRGPCVGACMGNMVGLVTSY